MTGTPAVRPAARPRRGRYAAFGLLGLLVIFAGFRALTVEPRTPRPYLNPPGRKVVVLGHQGASGHAPSNTLASFDLALQQGADVLELDVHLTKDGQVVVSHDETIDRMSNGSGYIKSMTLADLRQFDFGFDFSPDGGKSFPYRGKGVSIPTLEEVFKQYPGVPVNIELKQVDPPEEQQVWDMVEKYGMQEKVLINSFPSEPTDRWHTLVGDRVAVGGDRSQVTEFVAYFLPFMDWLYHPKFDAFQIPVSEKVGPVTIHLDSKRLIDRAHKLGMKVHYWTINDEATMRHLVEIGADGLITDYPDRAVKVLKEAGLR
jgi:glycerophosphoryl diester phosphodiesterase